MLVRVHAIGVNPPDWYLRDGYPLANARKADERAAKGHIQGKIVLNVA